MADRELRTMKYGKKSQLEPLAVENLPELLTKKHLIRLGIVGSLATLNRRLESNPDFPRPLVFGPRTLRFRRPEILAYIKTRERAFATERPTGDARESLA